jgi:hypothetical protein
MAVIALTQNQIAVVDNDDYDMLMRRGQWCAHKRSPKKDGTVQYDAARYGMRMTHHIMSPLPYHVVHHVNGDTLDNRKENLMCVPPEIHGEIHSSGSPLWDTMKARSGWLLWG